MSVDVDQAHISSFIVHCLPDRLENILADVKQMNNVEAHAPSPAGKFVALLESEDEHQILSTINRIQSIDGVLTATMVYHEIDDGTDGE